MSELKAINSVFNIEIEKIDPNPDQPRKHFSQESLNDLAESIRRYGVMQPITVVRRETTTADGGITTRYEIIAGERRWRASIVAGMASIPAIVRQEEETEQERFELSILENLQREDLNPVDKARSFARLADEFDMKHAEIADKLGKSREYVTNALRLLVLPENVLDGLSDGDISEGHTRPLLMLKDKPDEMQVLFSEIKAKSLTVRDAEKAARELSGSKRKTARYNPNQSALDPEMESLQQELAKSLGTTVSIDKKEKGGKLTIDFFSREDLKKLLSMVGDAGMADMVAQQNLNNYDQSTIGEQLNQKPVEQKTFATEDVQVTTHIPGQEVSENNSNQAQDSSLASNEFEPQDVPSQISDQPVILHEEVILKEDREGTSEQTEDLVGNQEVGSSVSVDQVQTGVSNADFMRSGTDVQASSTDVFADKEFTITPQVNSIELDESLAGKDIIPQSAHSTDPIDRGVGMNPVPSQTTSPLPNRAQAIQDEINALAGNVSSEEIEQNNYAVSGGEPKHLDLGDLDLHEPEFTKPSLVEPSGLKEDPARQENHILEDTYKSEDGNVIDPVFSVSDSFVPQKTTESDENTEVSIAGDDFVPNNDPGTPVEEPTALTSTSGAEVTMGGLGGGNLANKPTGPSVNERYPQGDPYRLDNFSL